MTDITGKDNKYYSINQYNFQSQNVNAETNDYLLFPIIENSSDYSVAISKARVDLSGIPLTTKNFPLKTYQVGLKNGNDEYFAYVRQLGAENVNYVFNVSAAGTFSKYKYDSTTGSTTNISLEYIIPISNYLQTIYQFVETDYQNTFLVGSAQANAQSFEKLIAFNTQGEVIYEANFTSIQAMCLDRQSNLYIADETDAGSIVKIYSLVETSNPIQVNLIQQITLDANGDNLKQIQTMCAEADLIVGSEANKITIYNTTSFDAITTYNEIDVVQLGHNSAILSNSDRFCLQDIGSVPDLLFGLEQGSDELTNLQTGGTFNQQGQWAAGKKTACSSKTNIGVGVGSDDNLYSFTYNPQTGTTSDNIATGDENINNCFNGTQNGNFYTLQNISELHALNAENSPSSGFNSSELDSAFGIGGSFPICCDSQISTNKIVALDTSNQMHITSFPILYKSVVSLTQTQVGGTFYSLTQDTTGSQINQTQSPPQVLIKNQYVKNNNYSGNLVFLCMAQSKNLNKYYVIYENIISNEVFVNFLNSDYTLDATFQVQDVYSENIYGLCAIKDIGFCITNGTNIAYLYDNTGTLQSNINLGAVAVSGVVSFQCACSSDGFLAISTNNQILIWDVNTLDNPILKSTQTFSPIDYPTQYISGIDFVNLPSPGTGYQIYFSTNGLNDIGLGNPIVTTLWTAPVDEETYLFTVFPTLLNILPNNKNLAYQFQNIYVNTFIFGTEITCKIGDSNGVCTQNLYCYNVGANGWFSQYTTTPIISEASTYIDCVPLPRLNNTYSWKPITVTGGGTIVNFGISQTNPNLIYALNSAGTSFVGNLENNAITFTENTSISAQYQTVNVLPQTTAAYDTYMKTYSISSQAKIGDYHFDTINILGMARNAIANEFLVSTNSSNTLFNFTPDNSLAWTNTNITGLNLIYAKNGEDLNFGDISIYDFQTLIDAINAAFLEAYNKVPSGIFSQAPFITLNFQNGLATLSYSSDYTSDPLVKGILMNSNLHQLLYFFSTIDTFNPNYFLISLPENSTSLQQTSKSLYLFNQLDKILFISNTIFVFGSYFGQNSTNNIVNDIDVPTNADGYMNNISQVLYFQPTFLRPYIMASQNPLQNINLQCWYSTLQGEQYRVPLVPGGNWNARLIFPRRY